MKKFFSMFCCVALLLSLLNGDALAVHTYSVSDAGFAMLKEWEGYQSSLYQDDKGDWYIGYGTKCNDTQVKQYENGITESEAELLFREALVNWENAVNEWLLQYAVEVEQYQFDAMVSMTYTLGTQWMQTDYRFCSYLIHGIEQYSEEEVVNAIATWCHQGTNVVEGLVARRLREAYLFLYGDYNNHAEEYYAYLHLEPKGGSVENSTVFYPIGQPYGTLPAPSREGRVFLGWYTEDGTLLTEDELVLENQTVTARWVGDAGNAGAEVDVSTWVNPYHDVSENDWYYSYVRELSAKGIVGGYEDGTFRQANVLKTGEALKLVLRAVGYEEQAPVDSHWASGYLLLAMRLGCFAEGETVDLEGEIRREKIAEITTIALGLNPREGASPFADADSGYLRTMFEEKIFGGTVIDGQRFFYPDSSITRAEICAVVSRVSSWVYVEEDSPARTGFITYRNQKYPVLPNVAVCQYDTDLFVRDDSDMTMYYNDAAYHTELGIDVSSYQGDIDWTQVAASGVDFVMIRLGYRGYGKEGKLKLDAYFEQNLAGAKQAGLKVGVYFFSQAITVAEAQEEAAFVLENLKGVALEYPVVFDWEKIDVSEARTNGLDVSILTDCAIAFCDAVSYAGYTPMLYYSLYEGYTRYDLSRLTAYDVWFAQYAKVPTMYYHYRIWQYTDSGTVAGISGKVDRNIALIPYGN